MGGDGEGIASAPKGPGASAHPAAACPGVVHVSLPFFQVLWLWDLQVSPHPSTPGDLEMLDLPGACCFLLNGFVFSTFFFFFTSLPPPPSCMQVWLSPGRAAAGRDAGRSSSLEGEGPHDGSVGPPCQLPAPAVGRQRAKTAGTRCGLEMH